MKIKKLTIMGFKSFMERVELDFTPGISAVVGPNGSGKSNIVDAIRWVLGEQSTKQLRAKSMEDVIFNGTNEFKPLGMAEASILIEGDSDLPEPFKDYSELSITRRIYRSGESEYLINNIRCRLKDIQNIFMDTGLGNRAYSIIAQGEISSILEQRPEDTRKMLEEAAGITRYRKQVEEAQRKLQLTKNNLERIGDLLREVKRQKLSLKRQANKAIRFKKITEEIRDLEIQLNSNLYHELKILLKERSARKSSLKEQETLVSSRYSTLEAELQSLQFQREEHEKVLQSLRREFAYGKERIRQKERELEQIEGNMERYREVICRLRQEKAALKDRIGKFNGEKQKIEEELRSIKRDIQSIRVKIDGIKKEFEEQNINLEKIKEMHEKASKDIRDREGLILSINKDREYLSLRLKEIYASLEEFKREEEGLSKKMDILKGHLISQRRAYEELKERLDEVEKILRAKAVEKERLFKERDEIEKEIKMIDADMNVCRARIMTLKSIIDNFEGFHKGVRNVMRSEELKSLRDGHIKGVVAEIIQVEEGYEQAVESFLGEKLQYIIVDSRDTAKEALEFLRKRSMGRGSFILLDEGDIPEERKDPIQSGLRPLKEHVKAPSHFNKVVDMLLGETVIVKDIDEALSLWERNGRDKNFVTIDGDLITKDGVISGGRMPKSSQGILLRRKKMMNLEDRVKELTKKRERLEQNQIKLDGEIKKNRDDIEGYESRRDHIREEMRRIDRILFSMSNEMEKIHDLQEHISSGISRKGSEADRLRTRLSEKDEELKRCMVHKDEEYKVLDEKRSMLDMAEEEYKRVKKEMDRAQMELKLRMEKERGLRRERDRVLRFLEDSLGRVDEIDSEIIDTEERIKEAAQRKDELETEIELSSFRVRKKESKLRELEAKRNEIFSQIKDRENRLRELRAKIEEIRERLHKSELEESELSLKMENLCSNVQELYGIDLRTVYEGYLDSKFSETTLRDAIRLKRQERDRLGEVNLSAIKDYEEAKKRYDFIQSQREDLIDSIEKLKQAIRKTNRISLERFMDTFKRVDLKMKEIFPILFDGGHAGLRLTLEDDPLHSGVIVEVRPPGKRLSHMGLLSGGEKTLVALALLFSLYLIKPTPFCILDEVDASLDEANIERFNRLLKEIKRHSQVLLVTHNRRSMEFVDRLYGVAMEKKGVSKIVSVNLQRFRKDTGVSDVEAV